MALPTAPFHEDAIRSEVLSVLGGLPCVSARVDAFGNILASYRPGVADPVCALVAHMDHPAYVGGDFKGGVPKAYLDQKFPTRSFGAFSMWDLPAFELRDDCILSRACDDLIGCAAILTALETLAQSASPTSLMALFTSAEEVGLLGAAFLARSGVLPPTLPMISLETSAERPPAAMHQGVIVRVGDKTSVFDSGLVSALTTIATKSRIPHQRCLMPGGTCEASAFQAFGYDVAGLCVALGNYHNCSPDGGIAAEYVSLADCEALVSLCTEIGRVGLDRSASSRLRQRLEADLDAANYRIPLRK